jgi:hypothetical protein
MITRRRQARDPAVTRHGNAEAAGDFPLSRETGHSKHVRIHPMHNGSGYVNVVILTGKNTRRP